MGATLILFVLLHYFVYLDNASSEVPIIQSAAGTPLDIDEKIVLKNEIRPNYINPLSKLEYQYSLKPDNEIVIIERAKSIFSSDLDPVRGKKVIDQYFNQEEDLFIRGVAVNTYANGLFFLLQYIIAIAFIFFTYKTIKDFKELPPKK